MYLQAFLDFRTQYSEEIYSRDTLALLQVILGGAGARITTICRPDVRADYTGIFPVFDDIDIEIVQIATQECLTTGNPLVLPESLQWRYEFTLFFALLFTRYDEYPEILEFQSIMWELMRFPLEKISSREWNNLAADNGWNTFMVHQALDSVSDGSWTGGDNYHWGTFLINDLVEAKAFIKDGTWWLTKTVYKVVKDKLDDSASDNDDDWFANIMEKQCEQIRLGVTMTPLKSLNYPKGA